MWVSFNELLQNDGLYEESVPTSATLKRQTKDSHKSEDIKLQITLTTLVFNDQESQILQLRDITSQKRLQKA